MSTPVETLVNQVIEEGSFDATQTQALRWLDQRHRLMCARTRCFRKKIDLGPTVAGQQSYAIPDEVMELRELLVSTPQTGAAAVGVPYSPGRTRDLADGALGYLWLGGLYLAAGGGIFARDESSAGADLLALYPTPAESGNDITIRAVCRPAALVIGQSVVTPPEFDDALVEGAIATGLRRMEGRADLATAGEQAFAQACVELEGQVNRRLRGSGPTYIRVRGYNA